MIYKITITTINIEDLQFCWIDHLRQVLCIPASYANTVPWANLYLYKNGCFVKKVELVTEKISCKIRSVSYNQENKELYLHIYYQNKSLIWCFDYKFSLLKIIDNISILDLPLKYSNLVNFQNCDFTVFYGQKDANYVVLEEIIGTTKKDILIFDLNSFAVIGSMESSYKVLIVVNNKIIFGDDKGNYFIYRIEFNKSSSSINSKYICKLNPFKPHLYLNPYLLPCNNSACWECICYHYNIHKGIFKCNFDDCKDEHKLPEHLNPGLQLRKFMDDDFKDILKSFLEAQTYNQDYEEMMDDYENKFKFIEDNIDTRIECLKLELDNLEEKFMKNIEKIIKKGKPSYKNPKKPKKTISLEMKKLKLNKQMIGLLYNEQGDGVAYNQVEVKYTDEALINHIFQDLF